MKLNETPKTTDYEFGSSSISVFFNEITRQWNHQLYLRYGANDSTYYGWDVDDELTAIENAKMDIKSTVLELIEEKEKSGEEEDLSDLKELLFSLEPYPLV